MNMNNLHVLIGRIVRDINTENSKDGTVFARFVVAVDRIGKNDADKTDFFNCVAFGKTAEDIAQYFYKGKPIQLLGEDHCDPYTAKDGTKRYPWTYIVDKWAFTMNDPKRSGSNQTAPADGAPDGFGPMQDDDDVPF